MNFIFNLNAFSWKAMQRTADRSDASIHFMKTHSLQFMLASASGR
jgi:hypothetical protein